MDRLELVRLAVQELGDVSTQELSVFIEATHGVKIEPKFIPVFKATLRARLQEAARQAARPPVEQTTVEAPGEA
jgi:hypothetical protein